MSSSFLVGILFVTVCVSFLLEESIAAKIVISPAQQLVTRSLSVDIKCLPDNKESDLKAPVIIQIKGSDGKDIVSFFQDERIVYGADVPSRYKASGNKALATLTLTITEPQQKDLGEYTCRLTYLNQASQLLTHEGKGTFTERDIESVVSRQVNHLFDKVLSLETTVNELSRKESTESAFSATTNKLLSTKVGKNIALPDVKLTYGLPGYDKSTGIYTVPADGIYVFHLVISLNCKKCHLIGYLKANNVVLSGISVHDQNYYDQSSVSVTASLKKGDKVYALVSSTDSASKVGYYGFSSFSGYLLRPF